MKNKPECFGSMPNVIEKAENDCCRCSLESKCAVKSAQTAIFIANKCLRDSENWNEEFEDELIIMEDSIYEWLTLQKRDLDSLLKKYNLLNEEVKIKVRDGAILIERIK
ncbi:hypothetical protein LCGC14_1837170 [marine sediment metagenome]|uniref:Uncharacterized protein n=1 Tax=marine sediment metagenome TaxID=412755 RepID=A0A0F9ITQ0_9ZZZZ